MSILYEACGTLKNIFVWCLKIDCTHPKGDSATSLFIVYFLCESFLLNDHFYAITCVAGWDRFVLIGFSELRALDIKILLLFFHWMHFRYKVCICSFHWIHFRHRIFSLNAFMMKIFFIEYILDAKFSLNTLLMRKFSENALKAQLIHNILTRSSIFPTSSSFLHPSRLKNKYKTQNLAIIQMMYLLLIPNDYTNTVCSMLIENRNKIKWNWFLRFSFPATTKISCLLQSKAQSDDVKIVYYILLL